MGASPKSARIIREATLGVLPAGNMEFLASTIKPSNLGTARIQPTGVRRSRHHTANIATGSDPALQGSGDYMLAHPGDRMIIEGATDRAAATGQTTTTSTIALTGGVLVTTNVGGWAAEAAWLVVGTVFVILNPAVPMVAWARATAVAAGNATLAFFGATPANFAEGDPVTIAFSRSFRSDATDPLVMLSHQLEIFAPSGKGDQYKGVVFGGFDVGFGSPQSKIDFNWSARAFNQPTKLTAALANASNAEVVPPVLGVLSNFGAVSEPGSGATMRLNGVVLDALQGQSFKFTHTNEAMTTRGYSMGTSAQDIFRTGYISSGVDFSVIRAGAQSDGVIDLLRATAGSTVELSVGVLDDDGNRRLLWVPALDLGAEDDSGVKATDAHVTSVSGMCRASSLIGGAYWLMVDLDA